MLYAQKNDLQTGNDSTSYFGRESCWSYKAKIYVAIEIYHWVPVQWSLRGDTVINQKNYKQCSAYYPFTAIRQENQKIYAVDNTHSDEYLLYDFGAEKGDIIYSEAQSGYISRTPTVEDVDSIWLYNGERRKRIHISGDTWIEGIGSVRGFDYPVREFVTCDCNNEYQLIAFAKEDTVSFFDSELAPEWGYCGKVVDVFPRSDAIWNIKINDRYEEYYGLSGDTIIDNKLYNKLYLLNDTTLNIDAEDEYYGCFRQEDKKVWYRPAFVISHSYDVEAEEETLLYDFSKNEGDTVWHNLILKGGTLSAGKNITASIVYDIKNTESGKIYETSQWINRSGNLVEIMGGYDFWREGIGSIEHGLFWFLYNPPMSGGMSYKLACFKQGDEVKYVDNTCNICFYGATVGIPKIEKVNVDVVYENKTIQIMGESSIFPCQMKLFSPTGQVLFNQTIVSAKETIGVNQHLKGVYLYQIQKDSEIIKSGKIIIN
jgi:hypothetical protein